VLRGLTVSITTVVNVVAATVSATPLGFVLVLVPASTSAELLDVVSVATIDVAGVAPWPFKQVWERSISTMPDCTRRIVPYRVLEEVDPPIQDM